MIILDLVFKLVVICSGVLYFYSFIFNRLQPNQEYDITTVDYPSYLDEVSYPDDLYKGPFNIDAPEAEMAANVYNYDNLLFNQDNYSPSTGTFSLESDGDISDLIYSEVEEAGVEE